MVKIVTKLSDLDRGIIGLFRKKPVVVKAIRLLEEVRVKTREGELTGYAGDWLIEGVVGEIYPCAKSIFEQTYEGFSSVDTELMKNVKVVL